MLPGFEGGKEVVRIAVSAFACLLRLSMLLEMMNEMKKEKKKKKKKKSAGGSWLTLPPPM